MASAKGTGRKPVGEATPNPPRGRAKPVKRKAGQAAKQDSNKGSKNASKKVSKKASKNDSRNASRNAPKKVSKSDSPAASTSGERTEGSIASAQARTFLARPVADGPVVTLGLAWFVVAVATILLGRWATLALWGSVAVFATVQVGRVWGEQPRGAVMPRWAPGLAAALAAACVAAASVGTALGGVALISLPLLFVVVVTLAGNKPAAASGAVIGLVMAAVPAMSVVLVQREGWQPALFLVAAVSFYDAGYFIGAAESSSRLEGPVTGTVGLLAVTFAASAFETAPFDRVTAWIAGAVLVLACPLGKMLVAAELPHPQSRAPAIRRLDSYLVAAPLMLAATWALS